MKTVGIVGRGTQFEVLAKLLEAASTNILLWEPPGLADKGPKLPAHVKSVELHHLADVSLIFYCSPIHRSREVARILGEVVTGRHVIVHTSRSLEPVTLNSMSQILQEETSTQRLGFLTGPMLRDDVLAGRASSSVCASVFPEVHDLVADYIISPQFRVYRTDDIIGAEVSAAYARIIAMIMGLSQVLEFGTSVQATVFARGLAEMARFVVYQSGYERTTFGLAGAGNLYADTHREGSVAFQIGGYFAQAEKADTDTIRQSFGADGHDLIGLLNALTQAAQFAGLDLHILRGAQAIIAGAISPQQAMQMLMTLPVLHE